MNPGKMDRRIIIQNIAIARDSVGGVVETWTDQYSVWAEIPKHDGNEALIADTDRPQDARQFRIRHRDGLRPDSHRISYQDKIYDIRHIGEEGRQNRLLITATHNQNVT